MQANAKKQDIAKSTPPVFLLHWEVLEEVAKTIGSLRAESGGAIGGNGEGNGMEVSHYHFDESSRNSAVTYSPDYKLLNRLFKSEWNPQGIRFRGFIHSHPGHMGRPSYGDEVYAERILKMIDDLECLWLPIINTVPDTGMFRLTPWAAYPAERGVSVVKGKVQIMHPPARSSLEICGVDVVGSIKFGVSLDELIIGKERKHSTSGISMANRLSSTNEKTLASAGSDKQNDKAHQQELNWPQEAAKSFNVRNTFDRVQNVYDLALMHKARIFAVGAGGAAAWLEEMARAGVGQFVMVDPDVVSETNLATQQTYRRDIGRPKVDCIAERIRDINPTARTIALQKSLDDLTDDEIRRLAVDPIDGCEAQRTIICGLTDSFFAQARVNRLALQFALPSLCAQVYREGRGAEVSFTYPGITPACHRCILSSRYRYFLEQGKKNDVTSHGTPIFATTRLNALKGFLTLALLHHGSAHPRWGGMLSRIGKRNLILLRMDPDFTETLSIKLFDRVFEKADQERLFFDEAIWLPQDQECPDTGYAPCPDCGGTGDLRDAIGRFEDTKLTPQEDSTKSASDSISDANVRQAAAACGQSGRMT